MFEIILEIMNEPSTKTYWAIGIIIFVVILLVAIGGVSYILAKSWHNLFG